MTDEQLTPEEIRDSEDTGPRTYKIRYEMIYRVWKEIEVTVENYNFDLDNETLEEAAFATELENDEQSVYTEIFESEISANGPDGCYILVQLVDPDGNVVRQATIEGNIDAAQVASQYLVPGMTIDDKS